MWEHKFSAFELSHVKHGIAQLFGRISDTNSSKNAIGSPRAWVLASAGSLPVISVSQVCCCAWLDGRPDKVIANLQRFVFSVNGTLLPRVSVRGFINILQYFSK